MYSDSYRALLPSISAWVCAHKNCYNNYNIAIEKLGMGLGTMLVDLTPNITEAIQKQLC